MIKIGRDNEMFSQVQKRTPHAHGLDVQYSEQLVSHFNDLPSPVVEPSKVKSIPESNKTVSRSHKQKNYKQLVCRLMVGLIVVVSSLVYGYWRFFSIDHEHIHDEYDGSNIPIYTPACFRAREHVFNRNLLDLYMTIHTVDSCSSAFDLGHPIQHVALRSLNSPDVVFHVMNPELLEFASFYGHDIGYTPSDHRSFEAPIVPSRVLVPLRLEQTEEPIPSFFQTDNHTTTRFCNRWNAIAVRYTHDMHLTTVLREQIFFGAHSFCLQYYIDLFTKTDRCRHG